MLRRVQQRHRTTFLWRFQTKAVAAAHGMGKPCDFLCRLGAAPVIGIGNKTKTLGHIEDLEGYLYALKFGLFGRLNNYLYCALAAQGYAVPPRKVTGDITRMLSRKIMFPETLPPRFAPWNLQFGRTAVRRLQVCEFLRELARHPEKSPGRLVPQPLLADGRNGLDPDER